ncbi:amino acid adenylation domain-containing protein [Micromonospora haikouensis]|uniref:Amino acid adenylation domain-containing protein n=1 Tax=Micromonospora haikouensis TaxID=686309 RepID=A0A1C4XGY2_9ACTN|nr:non-ribosomal peptide synthetase [Micromonospora haikouensis]SCF07695.1 amino acid adenylation domain-containing protein [Micromonospora haikouensis]
MSRPRDGRRHPLTPGQRGLWFLHHLDPQDTAYHCCTAIDLVGPLRPAALRHAVRRLGRWHDTLRTVFVDGPEGPWQVVRDEPPPLRLVDLSRVPGPRQDDVARHLIGELGRRPFRLRDEGPARWVLLRFGPTRHLLVLDLHHLVFDRDSLAVICAELDGCYTAGLNGRPTPARPDGGDASRVVGGWPVTASAPLDATSGPDGDGRIFVGGGRVGTRPSRYTTRLDGADLIRLGELCAAEYATPFMGLLAVVGALLSRYTGRAATVVGAPVSLRDGAEHTHVVGLLVNVVPLPLRVDPGQSMRALLRQARNVVLDALERRAVPLSQSAGAARRAGPEPGGPPVPVLLTYQIATPPPRLPGLECTLRPVPAAAAKYPLTVAVTADDRGWELDLEADPRHATEDELAAFARHLAVLVRAFGHDPGSPVATVELLDDAARRAALRDSSGPRTPRDPAAGLHTLVSTVVPGRRDAVAVVTPTGHGDRHHVSYATMWRSAGALARTLRQQGVTAEQTVAVLQPRGIGIPVSYLAILRVGGAVLPLDPADPDGRLRVLLAEAGAAIVVTDRRLTDRVAALGMTPVPVQDALRPAASAPAVTDGAGGDPPTRRHGTGGRTNPEQAAYVLFTSGSGGRPKAVVVPHRGIVNRVSWARESMPLRPAERVLFKTSLVFDVSVAELFWPLACGACLVVAEPGGERDPAYLVDLIRLEQVAYTHFVPSMLAPFLAEVAATGDRLTSLRTVVCSGEALADELARRAGTLLDARLHNLYGPTEASVEVLAWECDRDARIPVALGRPIANIQCRIVDDRMRPVPAAALGELVLGGACVARGYAARPGLTAASFVPAPDSVGARLYRTGDYGHRASDGTVHLVGRRDQQIKLLGRRIEPDEVSAVLRRQPGIMDAVVVSHGNRLVGFAVITAAVDEPAIRTRVLAALRVELPAYLVPAVLEFLPRIPLLRTGKADRAALTVLAERLARRATPSAAPRTELEHTLARAWRATLDAPEIGLHDGFFEAGGDSLALLRLHRRLVQEVAPDLTVRELFRYPSVAALAGYLADRPGVAGAAAAATARAAGRAARRRAATGVRSRAEGGRPA